MYYIIIFFSDENLQHEPYIYKVIGWSDNPRAAALCAIVVMFVEVPVVWLMIFGFYRLRLCLASQCDCTQEEGKQEASSQVELTNRVYGSV